MFLVKCLASYVGEESYEDVKNSQMRKVIAKRLGESKFTPPLASLCLKQR